MKKNNVLGINFLVSPALRIVVLFLAWIIGAVVTLFISAVLNRALSGNFTAYLRISTVIQDLLMWIFPAIATAVMITRRPARLLGLESLPTMRQTILAVLLLIVSTPLMTWIIDWNANLKFPESLAGLEESLRQMEANAESVVTQIMGNGGAVNLIINVMIIGVLAGLSEELFFRGALQRIMVGNGLSPHGAIWIGAVVFSAFHFQFFGFVPRMFLGALFGYLLWWSGSVWLPVLIHSLNNISYVILMQSTGSGEPLEAESLGWPMVALSVIMTTIVIVLLSRSRRSDTETEAVEGENLSRS